MYIAPYTLVMLFVSRRQLLDTSSESSLVEGSATKPCLPGGKDVDNRHGSGLRPMKLPSLLQIVQVNSLVLSFSQKFSESLSINVPIIQLQL